MTEPSPTPGKRLAIACGLAVVGGVTLFLGWVGFGFWPLELMGYVPLWAALELVSGRPLRTSFGVAWLYGVVAIAGGYHWMFQFCQAFSGFGVTANLAIFVAFSGYLGLKYALQGLLYATIRRRGWGVAVAALPSLLVTEWLFPEWFPIYAANALQPVLVLVQMVDLGGPLLVSALVAMVNIAVFETLRWRMGHTRAPVAVLAATGAFVAFALIYGAARIHAVDAEAEASPAIDVGLVQVNMGVFEKQEQMLESHRRHLEQTRALEAEGPLDLVVWPESAYNFPRFGRSLPIHAPEVRPGLESPILFGGLSMTYGSRGRELFNSVYLMHEDAIIGEVYDKNVLAMFGEYLPFGEQFPRLYLYSPNSGRFTRGTHLRPLTFHDWRISTPVCYEAVFPILIRNMIAEADPHLIVNLTNDAWFGHTQEPKIHLRLAQLRSIEHRRYMVRATNSGNSAIIDPVGRILATTSLGTRENLRGTVHMMEGTTLYARLGDWPGWLGLLATLVCLRRKR